MSYLTLIHSFFPQKHGTVEVKEMDLTVPRLMLRLHLFYEVMSSRQGRWIVGSHALHQQPQRSWMTWWHPCQILKWMSQLHPPLHRPGWVVITPSLTNLNLQVQVRIRITLQNFFILEKDENQRRLGLQSHCEVHSPVRFGTMCYSSLKRIAGGGNTAVPGRFNLEHFECTFNSRSTLQNWTKSVVVLSTSLNSWPKKPNSGFLSPYRISSFLTKMKIVGNFVPISQQGALSA